MTSFIIKPSYNYILKTGRRLGRPDILFWTLPWLMVLIFIGTIAQKDMGLFEAQKTFFSSFFFFWNGLPIPSGYTILTLLAINLTCKFLFLSPWTKAKIGIHIIHLSIMVLLFGGMITALTMKEGFIAFKDGQSRGSLMAFAEGTQPDQDFKNLPFTIQLNKFRRDTYPGSDMPRDYESRVTITDGDIQWPAIISMNEPLRYGGYTFYQSSTSVDKDGQPVSILSVVTNSGWIFPYISGIMLAVGLIYHLIYRMRKR